MNKTDLKRVAELLRDKAETLRNSSAIKLKGKYVWTDDFGDEREYDELIQLAGQVERLAEGKR
jgi:hypothetical protein